MRGVGYLNLFQGRLLPHSNTGTVQEISEISRPGSDLSVQSTTIRFVLSTHGVHCRSKEGETDGHTQGYKDPPIPRRLVGESQILPNLSPAYTGFSKNVLTTRLAGEFGEIRAGTKTSLRFCRLPVRPQVRSGLAHTGLVAEPSRENTETAIHSGLCNPAVHVLDRSANRHRKASSPRPTPYETHTVASQKQLEDTRVSRKSDPNSQITAPPPTVVAGGRQFYSRSTITPNKTCSVDLYRRIKSRVGHSLKTSTLQEEPGPFQKARSI